MPPRRAPIGLPMPPRMAAANIGTTDGEVEAMRERLAREEGLYVGFSAAANVCGAIRLLNTGQLPNAAVVVTVLCDTGLKY